MWLHNFIDWSEAEAFPNPVLTAPEPSGEIEITLHGFPIVEVRSVISPDCAKLRFEQSEGITRLTVADIGWTEIIELLF